MIARLLLSSCLLLGLSGAAVARDGPEEAEPAKCTRATAVPATIQAIMDDQEGWRGRCVRVRSISNGLLLFTSVEGYYLAGPLMGGDPAADPKDRERLGLDNRKLLRRHPRDGLRKVTAIGRVQDCETVRDMVHAGDGPDGFSMVLGFCHSADGPYLWLRHFDIGKRLGSSRLIGEALRAKVGDLAPTDEGWAHRAFVEPYARNYLDALRRGDRAGFRELHGGEDVSYNADEAVRIAFGGHRGFARLRRADAAPQVAIFVQRRLEMFVEPPSDPEDRSYSATLCFCVDGDCSGRWPIAQIDADNRPERPYVCTHFGPYVVYRHGTRPVFRTGVGRNGLPEPETLH